MTAEDKKENISFNFRLNKFTSVYMVQEKSRLDENSILTVHKIDIYFYRKLITSTLIE